MTTRFSGEFTSHSFRQLKAGALFVHDGEVFVKTLVPAANERRGYATLLDSGLLCVVPMSEIVRKYEVMEVSQ